MDLTVVSPTCPRGAAALLLSGVARQDVVAIVCIIQVIVTLLPLVGEGDDWINVFGVNHSCWWAEKAYLDLLPHIFSSEAYVCY